jgi:transposase-like protein
MSKFKNLFYKWNNLEKCPKCKSTKTITTNTYYEEHWQVEYDIVCENCNSKINHFAYGYLDEPNTKLEYIKWLWDGYYLDSILGKIKRNLHILFY